MFSIRHPVLAVLAILTAPTAAAQATGGECPTVLTAEFDADQVTYGSSSPAAGTGTVVITKVPSTLPPIVIIVRVRAEFTGLAGTVSGVHLHFGMPGQNGTVALTLTESSSGVYEGMTTFSGSMYDKMAMGGTYLDVHTTAFPAGEIRGQITAADLLLASIARGGHMVPPNPSTGRADSQWVINADRTLSYHVEFRGLSGPVVNGELCSESLNGNGPVIAKLALSQGGAAGAIDGTTSPLTATQIERIRAGQSYLVLSTAANPSGEIRGRVSGSFLPFEHGCGATSTPRLAGDGLPRRGGEVKISVADGLPGQAGLLLLGAKGEYAPITGCTLYVGALFHAIAMPSLDDRGAITITGRLPATLAPQWIYMQYFGADPTARSRLSASNGLGMHITE